LKSSSILPIKTSTKWITINTGRKQPYFEFRGENPPYGAIINFFGNRSEKGKLIISNDLESNFYNKEINISDGINRFLWPFILDRNSKELENYKRKFIDLVDGFSDIVLNKKNLKSYDFQKLNSFEEVNKLRKKFLDEFGMYANGKNIFGEKVYQTYDIKPGKYKIKIELESGESFTDTIIVRDDPIKSN